VGWVGQERGKPHLHPLLIISIFVVAFLEIHPFQDGNGRLSRSPRSELVKGEHESV
jgi:Fic family protein